MLFLRQRLVWVKVFTLYAMRLACSCSVHATSGRVFIHCIIFILSANVYYYYTMCLADAAAVLPDFKVEQCIDTQGPVPLPRTSESRLGFQFLGL